MIATTTKIPIRWTEAGEATPINPPTLTVRTSPVGDAYVRLETDDGRYVVVSQATLTRALAVIREATRG